MTDEHEDLHKSERDALASYHVFLRADEHISEDTAATLTVAAALNNATWLLSRIVASLQVRP